MPNFRYTAVTANGKIEKGKVEARDQNVAATILRSMELLPQKIEQETFYNRDVSFGSKRIPLKVRAVFCRQIAALLKSGVPILKALDVIRKQTKHPSLNQVLFEVHRKVKEGTSISQAIMQFKDRFDEYLVFMLEAGEASGNLDDAFAKMADHYDFEDGITKKIAIAMIYPAILLVVLVIAVSVMLMFVMPRFTTMYSSNGAALPGFTQFFLNLSGVLIRYWWIIFPVLIGMIIGLQYYFKTLDGKKWLDRFLLKVPVVRDNIKKLTASRFTRTLSTLLSSGIPLASALEIVAKVVGNTVFKEVVTSAVQALRKGQKLSSVLETSNIFPPMVVSMIDVGEESGSLDALLKDTAAFYDREVEEAVKGLMAVLEPALIVIMALVVGTVVIAMILPIFNMGSAIK